MHALSRPGRGLERGLAAALTATFFFAILTLWVPAYWPVAVFEIAVFLLAIVSVVLWRNRLPRFSYPVVPLSFAVGWGLFQLAAGRTVYAFETKSAIVAWAAALAVFLTGSILFTQRAVRNWFRSAMLWFSFAVSLEAVLQSFTSGGKVFWIFQTSYTESIMGPIIYRNHYAAFIEVVLPIALYRAFRSGGDSLLYSGLAATLYASVVVCASRAGTLLATLEILTVAGILWGRGQTTGPALRMGLLKIAFLGALFSAAAGPQAVWRRVWEPDPYAVRREFALSSLHMAADRPWSGFGLGTWPVAYPRYATIDPGLHANRAHSDWLEWTADGGLPFGLMMATLLLWALRPAFRSVWGLGAVAVFLHAAVDYPFSLPALACWPVLVLAMLGSPGLAEDA